MGLISRETMGELEMSLRMTSGETSVDIGSLNLHDMHLDMADNGLPFLEVLEFDQDNIQNDPILAEFLIETENERLSLEAHLAETTYPMQNLTFYTDWREAFQGDDGLVREAMTGRRHGVRLDDCVCDLESQRWCASSQDPQHVEDRVHARSLASAHRRSTAPRHGAHVRCPHADLLPAKGTHIRPADPFLAHPNRLR